jgi:hypothetical protein
LVEGVVVGSVLDVAMPLIQEALDGFEHFDRLRIGYTDDSVSVRAVWQPALDEAAALLCPVFVRAGWRLEEFSSDGMRVRLEFTVPSRGLRRVK